VQRRTSLARARSRQGRAFRAPSQCERTGIVRCRICAEARESRVQASQKTSDLHECAGHAPPYQSGAGVGLCPIGHVSFCCRRSATRIDPTVNASRKRRLNLQPARRRAMLRGVWPGTSPAGGEGVFLGSSVCIATICSIWASVNRYSNRPNRTQGHRCRFRSWWSFSTEIPIRSASSASVVSFMPQPSSWWAARQCPVRTPGGSPGAAPLDL